MVTYTFKYIKDSEEISVDYTFDHEPTLQETVDQMLSYSPDQIVDYIRQ
tara:strand:+ start:3155 stop:3301 length:147 start_codon:yes stop_codon:yes gene_type:complete